MKMDYKEAIENLKKEIDTYPRSKYEKIGPLVMSFIEETYKNYEIEEAIRILRFFWQSFALEIDQLALCKMRELSDENDIIKNKIKSYIENNKEELEARSAILNVRYNYYYGNEDGK
jgi:hypothetical protein